MQVPVAVRASGVHGLGLFAMQPIRAGSVLWAYDNGDTRIPIAAATDEQKHFGYVNPRNPDRLVVCGDHARYWNFPPDGVEPNAIEGWLTEDAEAVITAARNIVTGEELLIAKETDADAGRKLTP